MKKAIIHISDLHISLHKDLKENLLPVASWLTTETNASNTSLYIECFNQYVKSKFPQTELFLVVTGDIANISDEDEYIAAESILQEISTGLNISKEKIIILPGDHDIHRPTAKEAYRKARKEHNPKPPHLFNEEKYINFSKFYSNFKEKAFPFDSMIIDKIIIDQEKILFLGINSNYKIDFDGGVGEIDIKQFRLEINSFLSEYQDYSKIAIFHHNLEANYDDKAIGQWDRANRVATINMLEEFNFKCIFTGNEHTRASGQVGNMYYSEAGVFSSTTQSNSFKIYEIVKDENSLNLKLNLITMQNAGKTSEYLWGKWAIQNNSDLNEIDTIPLVANAPIELEEIKLFDQEDKKDIKEIPLIKSEVLSNVYSKQHYRNIFLKIIKEEKLFHSGHFHWSDSSRAHNWIDVSKLLSKKENLSFAKNALIDVIETCNLENAFDLIIGLGNEGSMISTRLSVKYDKPFTYLPYSYRYEDHSTYEKELNFINKGKYKTILIITDVVHDGRTIRKLIESKNDFFQKVEKIIVISLFYTGSLKSTSVNMLNTNQNSEFDPTNDIEENRIDYYFVMPLYVEPCPYNDNYREDCIIVKEGLGCINKFYDEKPIK